MFANRLIKSRSKLLELLSEKKKRRLERYLKKLRADWLINKSHWRPHFNEWLSKYSLTFMPKREQLLFVVFQYRFTHLMKTEFRFFFFVPWRVKWKNANCKRELVLADILNLMNRTSASPEADVYINILEGKKCGDRKCCSRYSWSNRKRTRVLFRDSWREISFEFCQSFLLDHSAYRNRPWSRSFANLPLLWSHFNH